MIILPYDIAYLDRRGSPNVDIDQIILLLNPLSTQKISSIGKNLIHDHQAVVIKSILITFHKF